MNGLVYAKLTLIFEKKKSKIRQIRLFSRSFFLHNNLTQKSTIRVEMTFVYVRDIKKHTIIFALKIFWRSFGYFSLKFNNTIEINSLQ